MKASEEELRAALKECSDELAEWIGRHYNLLHYPQEKLRYDREMETVLRARALLKNE